MSDQEKTPAPAEPLNTARQTLRILHETTEAGIDPLGVLAPMMHAQLAWMLHPLELVERLARTSDDLMAYGWHAWQRAAGLPGADPFQPHEDDRRFAEPVWQESPGWDLVKEWYLLVTRTVQDALHETPGLSGKERRRAAFWWRKWLNAMAPTNFLFTNPVAMARAVETRGESLRRGFENFLADLRAGTVRMTRPEDFQVGGNLATTPGSVVHRNELLEVIHYAPTTKTVHAQPVVIVTPWINKFYVLDLEPRKSLVRYLLDQGFSVFITSWRNPPAAMRDTGFEDYLVQGVDCLVETARALTGAKQVHAVGYCIGGTALSIWMAWANRRATAARPLPVAHWTLLATLVDFRHPGPIEVFIDEGSVRWLTRTMQARGYLDGKEMATAFRLLRSNSLIWHYVVHGYLYGEEPPPFDVLYWNMDTTRMPYAMHSWYLRELYLENKLIEADALQLAGQPIDLGRIHQPLYAVSAEDDHIAPWEQCFQIGHHVPATTHFVRSSSGHILGIVNPPHDPPKRNFHAGTLLRHEQPQQWLARHPRQEGSWWQDWMAWLKPQAGAQVPAWPAATPSHPELAPAPGTYVLEK